VATDLLGDEEGPADPTIGQLPLTAQEGEVAQSLALMPAASIWNGGENHFHLSMHDPTVPPA
jgi:hypothetical protein